MDAESATTLKGCQGSIKRMSWGGWSTETKLFTSKSGCTEICIKHIQAMSCGSANLRVKRSAQQILSLGVSQEPSPYQPVEISVCLAIWSNQLMAMALGTVFLLLAPTQDICQRRDNHISQLAAINAGHQFILQTRKSAIQQLFHADEDE